MTATARLRLSQCVNAGGHIVVSLGGELDIATADEAYTFLHATIRQPGTTVAVDANQLSFCGAAGLRVLIEVARDARIEGRPFMMATMRPALLRMIRVIGLHRMYPELLPRTD